MNQTSNETEFCKPVYLTEGIDTKEFTSNDGTTWWHSDAESSRTRSFRGSFAYYPAGGYQIILPHREQEFLHMMEDLESSGWLDDRSRMVSIEMTLFHAAHNLFR